MDDDVLEIEGNPVVRIHLVCDPEKLLIIALFLSMLSFTSMGVPPASGYDVDRPTLSFELLTLAGAQDSVTGGAMIAYDLEEVGFDITLKVEESSVMYQKIEDYGYYNSSISWEKGEDPVETIRPYDLIYMSLSSSLSRPTGLLGLTHSKSDYIGGDNQWGCRNSTLDGHLDWLYNGSIPQMQYHMYEAQTILNDIVPYIHVLYQEDAMLIRKGWAGMHNHPTGLVSGDNMFTLLDFHNTTNMPAGRNGKEWVIRYFKGVNEGNADGIIYYEVTTGRTAFLDKLMWEGLMVMNDDTSLIPWLAESYAVADDGMHYNFTLREGIKFQNGHDLDPTDVKYSFDWLRENEDLSLWGGGQIYYIENCTINADDSITFYKNTFDAWGLYDYLDFLIFDKEVLETLDYLDPTWLDLTNLTTKHTGTGPWKFMEVEASDNPLYWKFERNPDYWFQGMNDTPCETNTTYPKMDYLTIRVITDESATVSALRATSGTSIDCTRYSWPSLTQAATAYLDEIDINSAPSIWRKILWINNEVSPLSDPAVRKAMAFAINYDAICTAAEGGWAFPIDAQWLPKDVYGTTWNNVASNIYGYDKAQAIAILEAAGYVDSDDDGVRENHKYVPPESVTTGTDTSDGDGGAGFSVVDALLLFTGSFVILALYQRRRR